MFFRFYLGPNATLEQGPTWMMDSRHVACSLNVPREIHSMLRDAANDVIIDNRLCTSSMNRRRSTDVPNFRVGTS